MHCSTHKVAAPIGSVALANNRMLLVHSIFCVYGKHNFRNDALHKHYFGQKSNLLMFPYTHVTQHRVLYHWPHTKFRSSKTIALG